MDNIEIVEYRNEYKADFKKISYEWLNNMDLVEDIDVFIIENCEEEIINKDGHIFFAKLNGQIVGTVALIKVDDKTYEMAKLSVLEKYRGNKLGEELIKKAIEVAKAEKTEKITLSSIRILKAATYLYEKLGFIKVHDYSDKYALADLTYEMIL